MHLTSVKQKRFMFEGPGQSFEMHQVRQASATGLTRCHAHKHATLPFKYTHTRATQQAPVMLTLKQPPRCLLSNSLILVLIPHIIQ